MIRTPKKRKTYVSILVLLFLIQGVGGFMHDDAIYRRIPAPPNYHVPSFIGSSLFVGQFEVQAVVLAIFAALFALPLFKYSGNVSLFAWQRSRPFWSLIWSVTLTGSAAFLVYDAIRIYVNYGISVGNLVGSAASAAILLFLRPVMVSIPKKRLHRTRLRRADEL